MTDEMTAYVDVNGKLREGVDVRDKLTEIDPSELVAFGVRVSSRYGQAEEMIDALRFLNSLSGHDNETLMDIESIWCDSKSGTVTISLRNRVLALDSRRLRERCDAVGDRYVRYGSAAYVEVGAKSIYYQPEEPDEPEDLEALIED